MPLPDRPVKLRVAVPRVGIWHLRGLVEQAANLTEAEAHDLVEFGSCRLDGAVVRDPIAMLPAGALLVVNYAPPRTAAPPTIRHQDEQLVVVEKPAGIPVQPTPQGAGNSLVEQVAHLTGIPDLHVVHRLDVGVSGLLALASSREAAGAMTQAFAAGSVRKLYLAAPFVPGTQEPLSAAELTGMNIEAPLRWVSRRRLCVVADDGKASRTTILHAAMCEDQLLLLLRLHTGRTHQIRAHLGHLGLPIIGDSKYGTPHKANRIGLHSAYLSLPHPATGGELRFWAAPPADFLKLVGMNWDTSCDESWQQLTL
jgi:RluA family pseudouridine synthase